MIGLASRALPRAGGLAALVAAAWLAGASFHRAFGWEALTGPVTLATLGPVVIVVVATAARRPAPLVLSVPVWVAAWLGVVGLTLFRHGSPEASGVLPAIGDGLLHGWARLLEVILPAPGSPDLLVVPQALTWLAAGIGAELVTRTRAALLPAVGPIVVFAIGVTMTVPGAGSNLPLATGLLAATGLLVLCRRAEARPPALAEDQARSSVAPRQRFSPGPTALGLPLLVVITVAALFAGPAMTSAAGGEPYDVRAHRVIAQHSVPAISPLDQVSAWLGDPDRSLFTVRLSGTGGADAAANTATNTATNIRLAVFDRFDGGSWASSAQFLPAGRRVPPIAGGPDAEEQDSARQIRQDVVIDRLEGPLLPAVDRPVEIDGAGLAVDVDSGTLLDTRTPSSGRRYTVVSTPPATPDARVLASSRPATGADTEVASRRPPGLPDAVLRLAVAASREAHTPFQRAYELEKYLRSSYAYSRKAPPGHTYHHLEYFLDKSRIGTTEQFATAFAVAARVLDLPSRVVVGFALPAGSQSVVVRGDDVLVWAEIKFAGVGWVPFYPTPAPVEDDDKTISSPIPGESSERAQAFEAASAIPAFPAPLAAGDAPTSPTRAPWVYAASGFAGLAVVAVVSYLAFAAWAPRARRWRRRAARTHREQVVGAWQSTRDALARAGLPVPVASTPAETARLAPVFLGPVGRASLESLATLVTKALYAADSIGPTDAGRAWGDEEQIRAQVRRCVPLRRRIVRGLTPSVITGRRELR